MNLKTLPLPSPRTACPRHARRDLLAELVQECAGNARGLIRAEMKLHVGYGKSPEDAAMWIGRWADVQGLSLDHAEILERQRQVAARLYPRRNHADA